jgi:hypothetical protein
MTKNINLFHPRSDLVEDEGEKYEKTPTKM